MRAQRCKTQVVTLTMGERMCVYQLIADTVGVVTGGAEARRFALHQEESRNKFADLGSKDRFGTIGLCARSKRQERSLEARSFVLLDTCGDTLGGESGILVGTIGCMCACV